MSKKVVIIGSGIGGLASANLLAKMGHRVTVLEKNDYLGGRAGLIQEQGYSFDKGPSWYLMPDVFEHYFELLGKKVDDYLKLVPLPISYRIFFEGTGEHVDLSAEPDKVAALFEQWEPGAGKKFIQYLAKAKEAYEVAKELFMYRNYDSVLDLFDARATKTRLSPKLLLSMHRFVSSQFKDERIQKILQYQLVFLGGSPYNTPALYSIMNHIDFNMGVFYPQGGIYEIIKSLVAIGREFGVEYRTNAPVARIQTHAQVASGVMLETGEVIAADAVVSNADMYHTEHVLLETGLAERTKLYWDKRTLAPSAFIMYLGIRDRIPELTHHNLIFAKDWKRNFGEIFNNPKFPERPSLYICAPSVTDPSVAPAAKENLFVLAPIASNLDYTSDFLTEYGNKLLDWAGSELGIADLRGRVEYRKDYCVKDFETDYNSYKGTALGLAHTLRQSVFLRPNNVSKKVANLYYVGAGTNPGIGMPICLISAELLAKRLLKVSTPEPLQHL
ncbi:MAG: phytoene desaturase [Candidatus Doudnabacteria bacterium]|nr:phytoene desaturase [Candidatus Doudnabacteria bacterium]